MNKTPASTVLCACGCKTRVPRAEAVGVNGKWCRREHFDRLLGQLPSPRQLALLLGGR